VTFVAQGLSSSSVDNVIALERDQQGDEPTMMQSRVLKCRETGFTGEADRINYNRTTGRIELAAAKAFAQPTNPNAEDMPF
jgi:hypothetical protein